MELIIFFNLSMQKIFKKGEKQGIVWKKAKVSDPIHQLSSIYEDYSIQVRIGKRSKHIKKIPAEAEKYEAVWDKAPGI